MTIWQSLKILNKVGTKRFWLTCFVLKIYWFIKNSKKRQLTINEADLVWWKQDKNSN